MIKCCLSKYYAISCQKKKKKYAHCCMINNKFLCCVNENGFGKFVVYVDRKRFNRKKTTYIQLNVYSYTHAERKIQREGKKNLGCLCIFSHYFKSQTYKNILVCI